MHHGATPAPRFVDVLALDTDLGSALGHRLVLLSLERWREFADLRFARIDEEGIHRLTRRVPTTSGWKISWSPTARSTHQSRPRAYQDHRPGDDHSAQSAGADDVVGAENDDGRGPHRDVADAGDTDSQVIDVEVVEVVGRGGRAFSNGEARLIGPPASSALTQGFLRVEVIMADGANPLTAVIDLAPRRKVTIIP
ncbi:MAG: hypothetical protein WD358_00280 [Nitriliruptoraceae bacterium]